MKIKENYAAIERTVALVKEKFGADSKIAVMFEKCISNTLQTTIKIKENDITHQLYQILLKLFKNGNSNVKIIINKIKRSCHE